MNDQAVIKDLSPSADLRHNSIEPFRIMRQFSREETFNEYVKNLVRNFQNEFDVSVPNSNLLKKKKTNSEQIQKILSEFSIVLLNDSITQKENALVKKELEKLESSYKYVMEKFLFKMEKFIYSCENLRENMENTMGKFQSVSRITAGAALVSSAVEVSFVVGNALQKIFHFAFKPSFSAIETFSGSISIAAGLIALTYMKWSAAEISKEVKEISNFLTDLVKLHKKGNWIDEEVINLFPHGINLKLLDEPELNNTIPYQKQKTWRHDLCYAILLTNTQKDEKLLKDDTFLSKVRMFVKSQAAEIWWNRRKIKKLLDNVLQKVNTTTLKDVIADHDVYFKKIALYLYLATMPLLFYSWNSGRTKFLSSSLLLMMSSFELTRKDTEDAEELKKVINKFKTDFNEIKEICQSLDSEDE